MCINFSWNGATENNFYFYGYCLVTTHRKIHWNGNIFHRTNIYREKRWAWKLNGIRTTGKGIKTHACLNSLFVRYVVPTQFFPCSHFQLKTMRCERCPFYNTHTKYTFHIYNTRIQPMYAHIHLVEGKKNAKWQEHWTSHRNGTRNANSE